MRKINKRNQEPQSLTRFKRTRPNADYNDLGYQEREDIRLSCLQEQFYLCAYCCAAIKDINDSMNEHVEARRLAPNRSLDYTNIVASCKTLNQCDKAHDSQPLPLTPFMDECETQLKFKISGRVEGLTPDAKDSIRVLNLGDTEQNNRSLIEKRKQLSHALLLTNGIDPKDGLDDDELLESVIADLLEPDNGRLEPFAPVVVNILRGWLVD